jgi:hypothetical protein
MFKAILLIFSLLLEGGIALSANIVSITGRLINEKTQAPVYKAEVYILHTDLNVESSETGSFNFFVNRTSLADTIMLLIARYEYESKSIRLPLARTDEARPTISMVRYFRAPEVLDWPKLLVAGKVTDETGKALEDVAIYASGTTGYTYSDASGRFTLKVEQMRPNIQPVLWFCKKGYKTIQIGLQEFIKRNIIHLTQAPGMSQSLTVKYLNADAELLEAVYVVLDGKIQDSTGVLGTVTLGIEAGVRQSIRISQRYYFRTGEKLRHAGGSVNLDSGSLKPEMTFMLTRDRKFALAPEFQPSPIVEWKDSLPYQDSLLIAQLGRFPDRQLEGLAVAQSKGPEPAGRTFEVTKYAWKDLIERPVIELPTIHISGYHLPIPPIPLRHTEYAPLVSESSEIQEGKPRSAKALNRAIDEHNRSIQYCYKQALKKNPNLKGTLELRFILTPEGEIELVEIISSSLAESEMERCIIERIKHWRNFHPINPIHGNRTYRLRYVFGKSSP